MKLKDKAILATIVASLFIIFLYQVRLVLFPFIAAIIIAYFLDPVADRLEKLKISRTLAVTIIMGGFIAVITLLCLLILPLLYSQTVSLFEAIPSYFDTLVNDIYPKIFKFAIAHNFAIEPDIHNYLNNQNLGQVFGISNNIISSITQSSIVIINVISLLFITPVLVFYMLRDWDLMVKKIDSYLPLRHNANIRYIFREIDKTLSGYVHGQFNVCVILGIFYSIAISATGLDFGFLIGFLTGFLSFIPYVGMLIGVATAIIVGLFQWGFDFFYIGIVALVFFIGQILESNFLTPKFIGDKIGLHPIWIIFGLFVFGALFGFIGILLAMPLTAICGVLIKFLAVKYKKTFVN